ncbi:ABC transporter substrate-binding protein [Phreatobacter stygius]|uniref:ABC transporter substrate-binding protein n=1 Tax=Phreatobacter stygius TaxID=1940610 RepID=A0A4D7AUK9_9HYPH|nr:ABC transporter substrate-binding protein [Phreatobacter stygius]QCI63351.1 ABC transporter substrate-binding protein [Phreatobacter stygius]
MNPNRRQATALISGALGGLASLRSGAAQTPQVIRIGVIQPLSGPTSAYGQETRPVIEYLVQKINASGGIKSLGGAKIEIVLADSTGQPARAAAEALRLITQENVSLLTGFVLTSEALAIGPVLDAHKCPMLTFMASESASPYLFSLGLHNDRGYVQSMKGFIDFLGNKRGSKLGSIVTASSNYEAGQKFTRLATERLKAAGYTIAGDVPLDTRAQDHTAAMLKIRSLKPDAVIGFNTQGDIVKLHRARYDTRYRGAVFIGSTGAADPSLWHELGRDIASDVLTRDYYSLALFAPGLPGPTNGFIDDVVRNAQLKRSFGQFSMFAAQSALVIKEALEVAGSTDRERIAAAIQGINLPYGHAAMIMPRQNGFAFAEDRLTRDSSALMVQWTPDATLQVVYPEAFAKAP